MMRTLLTGIERRAAILDKAQGLMVERGFSDTDMEDIRLACGISRGGLYHHFGNKRAVLDALVDTEVEQLVDVLKATGASPIPVLLKAASSHLGNPQGVVSSLRTRSDRLDYLSSLVSALSELLCDPLGERLKTFVRPNIEPCHVAELFFDNQYTYKPSRNSCRIDTKSISGICGDCASGVGAVSDRPNRNRPNHFNAQGGKFPMISIPYLCMTFAISLAGLACILAIPAARSPESISGRPFWIIMVWGPSLAAIILSLQSGQFIELLGRAVRVSSVPLVA